MKAASPSRAGTGAPGLLAAAPIFATRSYKRFLRTPETLINTIGFPIVLLLTLLAVFSTAVEAFDEGPYAQRLVPMMVVSGLMFGSIGTAAGLFTDLGGGYMERIRALPVAPSGPLIGVVLAEIGRAITALVALVAVGYAVGFRFDNSPVAIAGFVLVSVLVAISVVWVGLAMATVARSQEALVPPLGALFLVLLFFSRGMVPLEAYPGWAQPIVRFNPATSFVTALDNLGRGGELARPILGAVAWAMALTAVFGFIAVRGLRTRRLSTQRTLQ